MNLRVHLCSPSNHSRLSMAVLASVAVPLLFLVLALPAPTECGEENDPDWYSRSADMIKAQPPEEIYTRGRGHAYLGIPYGMPSNGTNAFKLPQYIDPYVDYTDVNLDFGPYCPQMVEVPGMPDRNFFIGQQDCLTLNLFHPVPPNATRKYPVYVVLHPGWLLRGTARDFGILGIAHNLVARGIVVVTVEYRLGTYGLFNFGTGAKGDSLRSLYDVIAALQWVHEHIHNFAGNNTAVTLGGWGDGGACLASWLVTAATNTSKGISHLFQQAAAQKLSIPLMQMEEPDGGMFPAPPQTISFRNIFLEASQRHTMRILMGWTRDEFTAIPPAIPAARYDKEYLRSEFFQISHLTPTSTNNVTHAFEVVVHYYLTLYSLNEATMGESEWYRLYIRKKQKSELQFMSDFLFRIMGWEDGSLWAMDGHTVLFYQFDAQPSVSFTPVVDASAARKFNASVGHLADLPYVFMAEQYFKPGEHNIVGALDKQPLLGEWNLADVMGRMMADFVWQHPTGTYFRPLERCELFPEDFTIFHTPWVSHISRNGGIARPVLTSIPIDLIHTWSEIGLEFFAAGQDFTFLPGPVPDFDHTLCSRVDASNALVALILWRMPSEVVGVEPRIVYMDGDHTWDACLPGLKRTVTGDSGLLISHTAYGQLPYNASKNCFLTLAAPLGYRLRVRALDFIVGEDSVDGEGQQSCERDTLHVFDHEQRPLDPRRMDELSMEERAPGRILGEYCNHIEAAIAKPAQDGSSRQQQRSLIMAESMHNALTLWWHSDGNVSHRRGAHRRSEAEGYRLLWSSFRARGAEEKCRNGVEFSCATAECIPLALGCNSQPDCRDASDLDRARQLEHHCEHIPTDFLSQLSGVKRLLICLAIVLLLGSLFLCCCASLYTVRRRSKEKGLAGGGTGRSNNSSNDALKCGGALLPTSVVDEAGNIHSTKGLSQPLPPNFSPPQVPAKSQRQWQLNAMERQPTPRGAAVIALRSSHHAAPLAAEQSGGSTSTSTSTPAINKTAATHPGIVAGTNLPRTSHLTQQPVGFSNSKNIDQRHLLL